MAADGRITIDTHIDGKGFNQGIEGIVASLGKVAAAVGIAFGIGAIINFGATAVKTASKMNSALTGLQYLLEKQGKSFAIAQQFINDFTSDGLVPATNAINAYKNLALAGFGESEIEKMLYRIKDAAAFGKAEHLTLGEAIETATSGIRQENSILVDNAGITKNLAKMWDEYADSIGTTANSLTEAQKRNAIFLGIMKETEVMAGASEKLAGSYAGKVAALGASFLNFKVAVGDAIIPVLSAIIPYVKAAVDWLTVLFNTFAQFVQAFFGVDMSASVAGYEASMEAITGNTEAAVGAQEDLKDAAKETGKAAKGALAPFDQLNVLAKETGKDAGGGPIVPDPGSAGGGKGDPAGGISDEILAKVEAFKAQLMGFLQPTIDALGRLRDALTPLGETIWAGLKWAWDNILVPMGAWVMSEALPAFLDLVASGANFLNEALIALQPLGTWLFDNFLKPAAEWAGQAFIDLLGQLTQKLNDLATWVRENPEDFRTMVVEVAAFFAAWKFSEFAVSAAAFIGHLLATTGVLIGNTAAWIANTAAKIADKAETIAIMALYAGDFLKNLATSAIRLATETGAWIASTAAKIAANVAQVAMNVAVGIWNGIAVVASAVTWAFGAAVAFLTSPIGLVIIAIIAIIAVIVLLIAYWPQISKAASEAWAWIVQKWSEAGDWFNTNVGEPIKDAFDSALKWINETWESTWGGITEFAKGQINLIIDFINGMIAAIASGINAVIGGMNSIHVTVPEWVPGFGGQSWGVSLPLVSAPSIPRLATGAVIPPNAAFAAILGDQRSGVNVEAPADLIRQIIREELGGAAEGDTNVTVPVYLDSEKIYEGQQRVSRRHGRSLLAGGLA